LFTRCTACHTVHPINASLLARGGGKFRCGKCKKLCNALDSLFDEWPAAGDRPPAAGDLPVLGMPIDLDEARKTRLTPDQAALHGDADADSQAPAKPRGKLLRLTWITMALVIAVIVTFKLAEFYQAPLLETPFVQSVKSRLGMPDPAAGQPFRDLQQIHLVSRELISHPFQADMLRLSATIVNRAPQTQPYPDLEVILLDASGEPVSKLRFRPKDYLAEGASRDSGMTPQAYLPLVLDLPDPGREAVGFELNFL
jgi:predicted Zn finger-like uncharacterized protein